LSKPFEAEVALVGGLPGIIKLPGSDFLIERFGFKMFFVSPVAGAASCLRPGLRLENRI
jgi:hypothetical protein